MTCHLRPCSFTPRSTASSSLAVHMSPRLLVTVSTLVSPASSPSVGLFVDTEGLRWMRMYRLRTASSDLPGSSLAMRDHLVPTSRTVRRIVSSSFFVHPCLAGGWSGRGRLSRPISFGAHWLASSRP